ncbi:Uncharacterised protein [Delftia tsuruhatensis]|uniref:SMI1/KNR4 family protein n=1 Tax=Delftia tsuruhatensis TaxID=180282 RepID=UPI001E73EAEA|nr:SMI1/KNR4 family protein [Delftia tsuruhatensis]CAB5723436.1 Uncharacterised protein [Delftia tsuruhatensis]CAC9686403.1 Uncharacterised protein [Delftia tsuruhatensis]
MTIAMTAEQSHQRIWEILDPVDSTCFQVVAAPAPGPGALAALEAAAGFAVPPAYAGFFEGLCRRNNGLCVMAREEVWPQAREFDVGPAWTFWRGLVLLGMDAPELPDWASISAQQRRLAESGQTGILPLLKVVGDGSRVWGIDRAGTLVETGDLDEPVPLDGDLLDLYAVQIAELVQRQKDMAQAIARRQSGTKGRLPG